MTNDEAIKILKNEYLCRINMNSDCAPIGACMTCEYAEDKDDVTNAIGLAIEALSKQCAGSEQVDKSVIVDFVAFQRERLKRISFDERTKNTINGFIRITGKAFIDVLSQTATNDEAIYTDDQCGDSTEMVDLKMRTITERLIIAKSLIDSVITDSDNDQFRDSAKKTDDVPDTNVRKNDFRPGDKFILELGAERKMFGEFEIAGTDLYIKTSLLEKLTRYEPEKFEIHNDHTDCIWYHYLDDDDDVQNACPSTCSQYRDGWNDAMKYIYCDGKGYQPYTRKAK